tara:strand:+ start:40 stop:735 length:696 start_codon:yes stop_codon:yes gene_type:complete
MATFEAQVESLTGLTIGSSGTTPTQAELSQFLKDGVLDVTNKWLAGHPGDSRLFSRVSAEKTSNTSSPLDLNGATIISVVREDGVTSDNWRPCREVPSALQHLVTDKDSLNYASKFNPVYMISDNGQISVFPAPGSDPDAFKVYYVNNVPVDKGGSALVYSHSDIGYFMDEKVYLVVLYAGIKALEAKLAEYMIDDEDVELVQALQTNLSNLKQDYFSAFGSPQQEQPRGG